MSTSPFHPSHGPAVVPGAGHSVLAGIRSSAAFWLALASGVLALTGSSGAPWLLGAALLSAAFERVLHRRTQRLSDRFASAIERVRHADASPLPGGPGRGLFVDSRAPSSAPAEARLVETWNRVAPEVLAEAARLREARDAIRGLGARFAPPLDALERAGGQQEEAIEETAALVANMRQSMRQVADAVDGLLESSDRSATSILELGRSIEEVAANTASLHERVDASTSSVHEMGASIRQVASGAEQVQEMAEETASAVTQMDRSIQEVSNHAHEAASLTERAHEGASAGREAVLSTIADIEQISATTNEAMERLDGLVGRIAEIGSILGAIDEINDETNLLSLNAAIIAAQAGEQGKAFLVVANHVKTLARRTAESTQDIERLIEAIGRRVAARRRSDADRHRGRRDRRRALARRRRRPSKRFRRPAAKPASGSARSPAPRRSSRATRRASPKRPCAPPTQIQQISQAIAEQKRASETMLENAESALARCLEVHRSTDEQRTTSHHITESIAEISDMIRAIGQQTTQPHDGERIDERGRHGAARRRRQAASFSGGRTTLREAAARDRDVRRGLTRGLPGARRRCRRIRQQRHREPRPRRHLAPERGGHDLEPLPLLRPEPAAELRSRSGAKQSASPAATAIVPSTTRSGSSNITSVATRPCARCSSHSSSTVARPGIPGAGRFDHVRRLEPPGVAAGELDRLSKSRALLRAADRARPCPRRRLRGSPRVRRRSGARPERSACAPVRPRRRRRPAPGVRRR